MLESYLESTLLIKSINWSLVLFLYSSEYTLYRYYGHRHQIKYIQKTFYLLCLFYFGLCREHQDGPPYVFAAIEPFSSSYSKMECDGISYLSSSILFFSIRIPDLCFFPLLSLNSSIQYHVLPAHSLLLYD